MPGTILSEKSCDFVNLLSSVETVTIVSAWLRTQIWDMSVSQFYRKIDPQIVLNAEVEILKEFAVAIQQFYTVSPLRLLMSLRSAITLIKREHKY